MIGFIFKELRLTGEGKKDASIIFKAGLNVVSGPSNTGKTFIFDCLDFMLGSSDKLKNIPELKGYSRIYLEIETEKETYTLETKINNNTTYYLYHSKIDKLDDEPQLLNRKSNLKNNISDFFLSLNNIENKKIRKNVKGDTVNLSYRNVAKLSLINEERIITKESPIVTHYVRETEESNILRFFLTSIDDSNIKKKISNQEIQKRKGKIDLLNEFIINADIEPNLDIEEIESQLDKINISLSNFTQNFSRIKDEYLSYEEKYKNKSIVFIDFNKKYNEINELLKRSYVLEKQYNSDVLRLKSTIELGLFISDDTETSCPTCKQEINSNNVDIETIVAACNTESEKIILLLVELKDSQTLIIDEKKNVEETLREINKDLKEIKIKLEKGIGVELNKTIEVLSSLNNKKSQLIGIREVYNKNKLYSETIEQLELSLPNGTQNYPKLTSDITKKLCKKMSGILKEIGENKKVDFNSETFEFEIGDSFRNTYGKGYRAIYYSVYIIALHETLLEKPYRIGVPVLDSPLVTYKKADADGEGIELNLAMDFYRYLSKSNLKQIIVFENEEPPVDIHDKVNYISFKGYNNGFIPN